MDYRRLNKHTKTHHYRTQLPEALFRLIGTAKIITTLDLRKAYNQVPLQENIRDKTAFWYRGRLLRWKKMPFGLKNAPAYFQALMDHTFQDCVDENGKSYVAIFLDDIAVFADTPEQHLERLNHVLEVIEKHFGSNSIQAKKSIFAAQHVQYLGHMLSAGGYITPQNAKVEAIRKISAPTSVSELKSFLGFVSYYRSFIPLFAQIVSPLHKMLTKEVYSSNKSFSQIWGTEQQTAFEKLKAAMCTPGLVLRTPDSDKPYYVHTDWCKNGIAALLTQYDDEGREFIVAAISRSLNTHEREYPPYEGEALAVVWAVKHFRQYLHGHKFYLMCDHKPLKWCLDNRELCGRLAHWAISMQEYDYEFVFQAGVKQEADFLSRHPLSNTFDNTGARLDFTQQDFDNVTIPIDEVPSSHISVLLIDTELDRKDKWLLNNPYFNNPMSNGLRPHELRLQTLQSALKQVNPISLNTTVEQPLELNSAIIKLPLKLTAIIVLELMGGIVSGLEAVLLNEIKVEKYYYVDNDDSARKIASKRLHALHNKFPQLLSKQAIASSLSALPTDVKEIDDDTVQSIASSHPSLPILVISGPPCIDFSSAGRMRGITGKHGNLTLHTTRVIRLLQHKHPTVLYLIENVNPLMKNTMQGLQIYEQMTRTLGKPLALDAARVDSYAHRARLYWTNIAPTRTLTELFKYVHRSPGKKVSQILPNHLKPVPPSFLRADMFYDAEAGGGGTTLFSNHHGNSRFVQFFTRKARFSIEHSYGYA